MTNSTALKEIENISDIGLANLASVSLTKRSEPGEERPEGADMLDTLRATFVQYVTDQGEDFNTRDAANAALEFASDSAPTWTVSIFEALVELQAWSEYEIEEDGPILSVLSGAEGCLRAVNTRLWHALTKEYESLSA
jgi:hypothetical protein